MSLNVQLHLKSKPLRYCSFPYQKSILVEPWNKAVSDPQNLEPWTTVTFRKSLFSFFWPKDPELGSKTLKICQRLSDPDDSDPINSNWKPQNGSWDKPDHRDGLWLWQSPPRRPSPLSPPQHLWRWLPLSPHPHSTMFQIISIGQRMLFIVCTQWSTERVSAETEKSSFKKL